MLCVLHLFCGNFHRHLKSGPPFSSFGPSRDYGMDLCLEVYIQARSSLYANTQLRAHRRAEEKKIKSKTNKINKE